MPVEDHSLHAPAILHLVVLTFAIAFVAFVCLLALLGPDVLCWALVSRKRICDLPADPNPSVSPRQSWPRQSCPCAAARAQHKLVSQADNRGTVAAAREHWCKRHCDCRIFRSRSGRGIPGQARVNQTQRAQTCGQRYFALA